MTNINRTKFFAFGAYAWLFPYRGVTGDRKPETGDRNKKVGKVTGRKG